MWRFTSMTKDIYTDYAERYDFLSLSPSDSASLSFSVSLSLSLSPHVYVVYTVWVKKEFTRKKLLIILKIIYEHYIIIQLTGGKREALFARVQKSTCAKVRPTVCFMLELAEWENELNVSNEMHCIWVLLKQVTHTNTHAHKCRWYSIFDIWYVWQD